MAFCTGCGTAFADTSRFCTNCGAMRPAQAADSTSSAENAGLVAAESSDDTNVTPSPSGAPRGTPPYPGLIPPPASLTGDDSWVASGTPTRRTRVIVAIVVGLLLLGGGTTAWVIAHTDSATTQAGPTASPTTTASRPPSRSQAPTQSTPPTVPSSTTPPTPVRPEAVQLTEGAASAQAPAVLNLLQRYFDATNTHNYQSWLTTVTPGRASAQTQTTWEQGYSSTHDSSIVITAITPTGPDGAVAAVSFTSTQSPTDAPPDLAVGRICWQMQLPITNLSSGGQVGSPPPGITTKHAC